MGGTNKRNGYIIFACQVMFAMMIIAGALLNHVIEEIELEGERVRSEIRYEASYEKGETLASYANRIDNKYESGKLTDEEYLEYFEAQEIFLSEPTNQNFANLAGILSEYLEKVAISYNEEEEDLAAFSEGYTTTRAG